MSNIECQVCESVLNDILSSNLFSGKETMKNLLSYLYENGKQGKTVHEIDIAIEVFNRKTDFNSADDTIVRVNLHKLRKALERYYLDEGKNNKIWVEIPKGSYMLTFADKKKNSRKCKKYNSTLAFILAFILLSTGNIIYYVVADEENVADHLIWETYLTSNHPTCITLGDPYFFRANHKASNKSYIVRDISKNNIVDMDTAKFPGLEEDDFEIKPLEYSYFSQNNVWPLLDILSIFIKNKIEPTIMPLSKMDAKDMKSYNHIVMGNINSLGVFAPYLEQSSIRVKTNPRRIIVCKSKSDSLVFNIDEKVDGYYFDHAFLVKVPGVENTVVSILGDFHASGNKGLSNFIANQPEFLIFVDKIENELGSFPEYFELLVEVKSYNYEDFETHIVYFNPL